MHKIETNVLILGKSGVGKSSFINYIYGEEVRAKGSGKPVTEKGLHKVRYEIDNIVVNLSDSWGLEANKTDDWKRIILDEVKKNNDSMSIKEWFHTIYYCFSASTARVEEFEVRDILKPLISEGNRVTIIITHCDVKGGDDKANAMISKLISELGISRNDIIKVCSERKKFLNGTISEPYGKEEVLLRLKNNLWEDIKFRIPRQYERYVNMRLKDWVRSSVSQVKDKGKIFSLSNESMLDLINKIELDLNCLYADIREITKNNITEALMYYSMLVRYVYSKDIDMNNKLKFDSFEHNVDIKIILGVDILNIINNGVLIWKPLIAPIGFVVTRIGKKYVANKLIDDINNQFYKLTKEVPNMRKNLEHSLNGIDIQLLLN